MSCAFRSWIFEPSTGPASRGHEDDRFFTGHAVAWFVATLIGILVIALPLMLAVAMIIYADRKIWAAMALRRGPNVVGPFGLLQSFADGLKVFLQETIIPSRANKGAVPARADHHLHGRADRLGGDPVRARAWCWPNINVGLLYVLAASSLGVYGVIIAGWASNSKYPFYSAIRAAAQMVSYEVSIGFVLISVVLWAGSFNLGDDRRGAEGLRTRPRSTASASTRCCSRWRWCS